MVQKEVADRMKAGPGSKEYGALSLAVQYYANPDDRSKCSSELLYASAKCRFRSDPSDKT